MSFRWSKPVVKGCRISHNTNFSIRRFDWWRQVPKDLHSIRRRSKSNQSRTGKHVSSSHILSWWLQYNSRTTSRHTSVTNNFKTFVTFLSPRLPHEGTFWYVNNRNRQLFSIPSMSAFLGKRQLGEKFKNLSNLQQYCMCMHCTCNAKFRITWSKCYGTLLTITMNPKV